MTPYPVTPILGWLSWRLGFTPVIPKFYYDAYSQEEIIKGLCKEIDALCKYAEYLGESMNLDRETINAAVEVLNQLQAGGWFDMYADQIKAWIEDIHNLQQMVDESVAAAVDGYDERITANTEGVAANAQAIADEATAREQADTALQTSIDAEVAARKSWNTAASIFITAEQIELAGQLDILAGHTTQGMEIYDGFVYVLHHEYKNDAAPMYISKFELDGLGLVGRNVLRTNMHGNSLSFDIHSGCLVAPNGASGNAWQFEYIDPVTLSIVKSVPYSAAGGVEAIAFRRDPNNLFALGSVPEGVTMVSYQTVETSLYHALVCCGVNSAPSSRNFLGKQDMCAIGDRPPFAQLCNNWFNLNQHNAILIYNQFGDCIRDYQLENVFEEELEGIACVLNSEGIVDAFYITDLYGKLYRIANGTGTGVITDPFTGWRAGYSTYNKSNITPAGYFNYGLTPEQVYVSNNNSVQLTKWLPLAGSVAVNNLGGTPAKLQADAFQIAGAFNFSRSLRFAPTFALNNGTATMRLEYEYDNNLIYLAFCRLVCTKTDGTTTVYRWSFVSPYNASAADNNAKYQDLINALVDCGFNTNAAIRPSNFLTVAYLDRASYAINLDV